MRLGLGCVGLGSGAGRRVADDVRLVRAAVDLGVTVFDTADAYGAGASEHVLGRAVKGRRDAVVIATKGGFNFRARRPAEQWARRWSKAALQLRGGTGTPTNGVRAQPTAYDHQDFAPRHLRNAVHASLRRLQTDRIDVYQLHGPTDVVPDLFDALSDLVTIGDVAQFGVGAHAVADADGWMGVPGMSVAQVPFGVLDPEAASTTFPLARVHGREVWARAVFGGGVLSLADRDPAAFMGDRKWNLVQELRRIGAESGLDQWELAFGFVRAHAELSTVIVGTTSLTHLRRNADLLSAPPLPDEVLRAVLDALAAWAHQEPL